MIAVLTAFSLLYGCICTRLYNLSVTGTDVVSGSQKRYTIDISDIRGDILDCNGEKLVNADYENIVAAKPTYNALKTLEDVLDHEKYSYAQQRMMKSSAITVSIGKQYVEENPDIVLLKKYIRYPSDNLADHVIGYLNGEKRGVSGIEKSFDDVLYTGESLSVSFSSDVHGRILNGTPIKINNRQFATGSVMLTLDSKIQRIVENAVDAHSVTCGGAVVVDISTGAIRAMVSRPDFNAGNISDYLENKNSPLLNRALNAYSVGSVFKVAIAATAIENGLSDFTYECKGSCEIDGTTFGCNKKTAHGKLDMTKALEFSCNTFFIALAAEVGAQAVLETASLMGFGQQRQLADGIVSKAGLLPAADKLSLSGNFANFSFGQGDFTATMLQLCNMMSTVAWGGKYCQPYLVEKVTGADTKVKYEHQEEYPVYVLSPKTSVMLTDMLVSVTENGNAIRAKLENGVLSAGKTATAQTGTFRKNGTELCNTWFAGFFPADNPKYTVVVLKEGGASGAEDCAPIFKCIADEIMYLEKIS